PHSSFKRRAPWKFDPGTRLVVALPGSIRSALPAGTSGPSAPACVLVDAGCRERLAPAPVVVDAHDPAVAQGEDVGDLAPRATASRAAQGGKTHGRSSVSQARPNSTILRGSSPEAPRVRSPLLRRWRCPRLVLRWLLEPSVPRAVACALLGRRRCRG